MTTTFTCQGCGHTFAGDETPEKCDACGASTKWLIGRQVVVVSEAGAYRFSPGNVTIRHHAPIPIDDPALLKIGRVTVEWAAFEHILDLTIWDVSGEPHPQCALLTTKMSGHGRRFDELRRQWALVKRSAADLADWNTLEQIAEPVSKRRNRIVHDAWYVEKGTANLAQFRALPKGSSDFGQTSIPSATLDQLISDIEALRDRAGELRAKL